MILKVLRLICLMSMCVRVSRRVSPILCDPMGCSPSGYSVHGDSPGKNNGVGCHALLQGIFMNMGVQLYPQDSDFTFFEILPINGLTGLYGSSL